MKENLTIFVMEKEPLHIQMELFIKENGKILKKMEREQFTLKMEQNMN